MATEGLLWDETGNEDLHHTARTPRRMGQDCFAVSDRGGPPGAPRGWWPPPRPGMVRDCGVLRRVAPLDGTRGEWRGWRLLAAMTAMTTVVTGERR